MASVFVLAAIFSVPAVEAAIIDRKLRHLIQRRPIDRRTIAEIISTLHQAEPYNARLSPGTLIAVQETLRHVSARAPELSGTAVQAAALAASTATLDSLPPDIHGPVFDQLPKAKWSRWEFTPIATNTGPDNYVPFGIASGADVARMERMDNPTEPTEYGPALLLVKGLTAMLDGWHLKHVLFQEMELQYGGGPLQLESVYFCRCLLRCEPGENAWQLLEAVSRGGWITLTLR